MLRPLYKLGIVGAGIDNSNQRREAYMLTGPVDLPFQVGQSVMYPGRGEATVEKVDDIEVAGTTLRMYVFALKDGGNIKVPLGKVAALGVRSIGTSGDVSDVIACLKGRAQNTQGLWIRRADTFHKNLSSGDICKVAGVIRDLHREVDGEVGISEREIYERGLYLLLSEVSQIRQCTITEAAAYLSTESGKALHYREGLMRAPPTLSTARNKAGRKPAMKPSFADEKVALTGGTARKKPGPKPKPKVEAQPVSRTDAEIARLKGLAVTLKQECDSLTAQNGRLQAENEALRAGAESSRADLVASRSAEESLRQRVADLQAEAARLRAEVESSQAELAASRIAEEGLRQRVANLEATLTKKEATPPSDPKPKAPKPHKRRTRTKVANHGEMELQEDGFLWNKKWG